MWLALRKICTKTQPPHIKLTFYMSHCILAQVPKIFKNESFIISYIVYASLLVMPLASLVDPLPQLLIDFSLHLMIL